MQVAQRVELLLQSEHRQLAESLSRTDEAVLGLRAPTIDKKAEAKAEAARARGQAAPAPSRTWSPRAIHEAWKAFHEKAVEHMAHERDVVLPLVARVESGGDAATREALDGWITFMLADNAHLRRLAGVVRMETMAAEVAPVRRKVIETLEQFEACLRLAEREIYASAPGGAAPVGRKRTHDDILHTLRRARPEPTPQPQPDAEPAGLFGRLKGLFGR